METLRLYRWGGLIGIVVGVLNIIVEFLPASLGRPLNLVVVILALWALTALYLRQRQASGVLGAIGYLVNSLGLALLVGVVFAQVFVLASLEATLVGELVTGTLGLAVLASLLIFTVGAVLFGIATIRAAVFSKWAVGLYIIGFLPQAVALYIPAIIVSIGEVVGSIGIIWLSYALWSESGELAEQPSPAA